MAIYEYVAKNMDGKNTRGRLQASNEEQAYQRVKSSDLFIVSLKEVKAKNRTKPLKSKHLADFSRQISTMLNSGIALVQAVNIMQQREKRVSMVQIYKDLYQLLLRGNVLSDAMEEQGGIFPPLIINMFRAGEASGQLGNSAGSMADYYEKDDRLKKKILSAMIYPAFLVVLTVAALIAVFTVVLPSFFSLFESMEDLPSSTRFLIWLSKGMQENLGAFLLLFVAVILAMVFLMKQPAVREFKDHATVKLPLIGRLMRIIYTARFARTLSSMYSNGIPLVKSLQISSKIIDNSFIEKQFVQVIEDVCNGVSLSTALSEVTGFDSKLVTSIYIGEEAGKLDTMLGSTADSFDYEADEATKRLTTLIEPIMIVIMAVVIGYIMISVMVPVYQYYQTIG